MTRAQLIADYRKRISDVNNAIDLLSRGAQSATISASGVSKSYTKANLGQLVAWRNKLMAELSILKNDGRMHRITGVSYV